MQNMLEKTLAVLVRERPQRWRVFDDLGLDYCCGGNRSLADACREGGVDPVAALARIRDSEAQPAPTGEPDFSTMPLGQFVDHIENVHHAYMHRELPRITALLDKVTKVHAGRHPELLKIKAIFEALAAELGDHLAKEEQVLFPMIRQMETATTMPEFHCGTLQNPIRVMRHEHDNAGEALHQMRELTKNYEAPGDACDSYRALYRALAEMERDLHQHIHEENNLLFPRAVEREARMA
jgi:regulator of cell morphogenesis and NO signaling